MSQNPRLPAMIAVPTVMLVMAFVTVMLRCWVKKIILKTFKLDDWFMLLSLVVFTAAVSIQYGKTYFGLGQHIASLPPNHITSFYFLCFISQIVYFLLTVFIKASISIFLLRLVIERVHQVIIYATLFVYVATSISFIVTVMTHCSPIAYFWDNTIVGGVCVSSSLGQALSISSAAVITATDLVYSLLPVWLIRHLQMDLPTKISVVVILSMGLLSTSATVVRFKYILLMAPGPDITYNVYGLEILSMIEPGLGITAASAITLRPLLRIVAAKFGFESQQCCPAGELQMPPSKIISPTFGGGMLSDLEAEPGHGTHPPASLSKLAPHESHSMVNASDAESVPRTTHKSADLEKGWTEK